MQISESIKDTESSAIRRARLIETNVVIGSRFRGAGKSHTGARESGHAAGHAGHTTSGSTAKFRGHFVDKSHYFGIVLILENVRRIRRDLPERLGHFRILQIHRERKRENESRRGKDSREIT